MERFIPEKGVIYKNVGGGTYKCLEVTDPEKAKMQSILLEIIKNPAPKRCRKSKIEPKEELKSFYNQCNFSILPTINSL